MNKTTKMKNFMISVTAALSLFILTRPVIVSALVQPQTDNNVHETEVGSGENGYSQIMIKNASGKITFLTDKPLPHSNPQISGQKVVWMAQINSKWQIFLHDVSIEKTIQLTNKGNNVSPQISGNYVVWEGIRDGAWQILLFDGIKITQLTQGGAPKQDVVIEGNTIAYSQKEGDIWEVYLFNIIDKTFTKVSDQNSSRKPSIKQNLVTWESFNDEGVVLFEYNVNDKKLKKLEEKVEKPTDVATPNMEIENHTVTEKPQPIPEPVTEKDIIEELDLEEIIEVPETPESTPSSQVTPSLEDLLNVEDVDESTTSGD